MLHNCKIYSSEEFESKYTYGGNDLGAIWSKDSTTFKVWSPLADKVELFFYSSGDKADDNLSKKSVMNKREKGVWECTVDGDLDGVFYCYSVTVDGETCQACDPYAKAVGVNGDRAMVVNLDSTNPKEWDSDIKPFKGKDYVDTIIYEMHVRDFSINEYAQYSYPGKYLSVCEKGVRTKSGKKAGLDYLKELGVTHVHILPIADYATVDERYCKGYNWGYDPKNYNVPEGSYSTNPFDGKNRILEFKTMINELHKNGIAVIMDVVYNHTFDNNFCYNHIVPEYFFRVDENGVYSNGSGCGNDVATERSMVRNYIVNSVKYWAEEYHIDGFRFDLMGLIDVDTMNAVRNALDEIDPELIMYGEGWDMKTYLTKENVELAIQNNVGKMKRIAVFNDDFRDSVKGKIFDDHSNGYISGNLKYIKELKDGIKGRSEWEVEPHLNVNFVSCHDNNTLFDKLELENDGITFEEKKEQNKLSALIQFTSQGMILFHSGEELMRTKIDENGELIDDSVRAGDFVNSIKWEDLDKEDYWDVKEYYKGLINIRKSISGFRLREASEVNNKFKYLDTDNDSIIAYSIDNAGNENVNNIIVIANSSKEKFTFSLPEGEWKVVANKQNADINGIETVTNSVEVEAVSGIILLN